MDEAAQPLVSIAIPAYNHGEFLGQAIDSALAQAYPRLKMLLVDDKSHDRLPSIFFRTARSTMHGEDKVSSVMDQLK